MSTIQSTRTRWAAIGAAVAVTLGAGGVHLTQAGAPPETATDPESFRRIDPCRLHDSRPSSQVGDFDTKIGPGETRVLDGTGTVGNCVIPKWANAIAVNAIGIDATSPTFVTLHAETGTLIPPTASNLNVVPGQPPTPNFAIVPLDQTGDFAMFNKFGSLHTVIDVVGYTETTDLDARYEVDVASTTVAAGFIGDDPVAVAEVELDPGIGFGEVVAHSSINVIDPTAGDTIRCSITTSGDTHADAHLQEWVSPGSPAGRGHLAGNRVITQFEEGDTIKIRLVCDHEGASGPGAFNRATLTAILVPEPPLTVALPTS